MTIWQQGSGLTVTFKIVALRFHDNLTLTANLNFSYAATQKGILNYPKISQSCRQFDNI